MREGGRVRATESRVIFFPFPAEQGKEEDEVKSARLETCRFKVVLEDKERRKGEKQGREGSRAAQVARRFENQFCLLGHTGLKA